MRRLTDVMHDVAEQVSDISRSMLPWSWSTSGIRGMWSGRRFGLRFWPTAHPAEEGTEVNYDFCRSLYSGTGEMALGSGFAKPIIDLQVAFMGMPRVMLENEQQTQFLNDCISNFWADEIQQMFRDAMRDSKCIVRLCRPDILDPLMTIDEAEHGNLEILPPERVDIERNARNKRIIERAVIRHRMLFVVNDGDPAQGIDPTTEEHNVIEIIDRQSYKFFDQTTSQWLTELETPNRWNFVPLLEVYNEWDSALQGGQSDLETVVPFIRAFADVLAQGLQAHNYHSTPKVVMKLSDVGPFIKNNFPDAVDSQTGELKESAEISWRGREILFLSTEEEVAFLEATSVLGDTKTLLEFLIDCICVASQTPEWAFMRVDSGSANSDRNAQTVPFIKKNDRKRRNYAKPVQELCKMILAANELIPVRPAISWDMVRTDDLMIYMQAFQQLLMGLEVARQSGEISDDTYQNTIRPFLPFMKSNGIEFNPPPPPAAIPAGPAALNQPAIKSQA